MIKLILNLKTLNGQQTIHHTLNKVLSMIFCHKLFISKVKKFNYFKFEI